MTTIPDSQLESFSGRANGAVVLITGGGSGIGKQSALRFAKHGAKLVLADLDEQAAQETAAEIERDGGEAIACKCDVVSWDEQVAAFEAAMERFGSVDVVIANAGINEVGSFTQVQLVDDKPVKPNLKTLEVDLIGAMYTIHLALHYLPKRHTEGSLKAILAMSSMAAWHHVPFLSIYSSSKVGLLALMQSIQVPCTSMGIRLAVLHPYFAETGMMTVPGKVFLAGLPMVPVERIVGTVLYAALDPDMSTTGSAFTLVDDGQVVRWPRENLTRGVYKEIDARVRGLSTLAIRAKGIASILKLIVVIILARILAPRLSRSV